MTFKREPFYGRWYGNKVRRRWWSFVNWARGYSFDPVGRFRCCGHSTPFHYQHCPRSKWVREVEVKPWEGGDWTVVAGSEPQLSRVVVDVCDLCLDGEGGECHVPGCAFWMRPAPRGSLLRRLVAAEQIITMAAYSGSYEGEMLERMWAEAEAWLDQTQGDTDDVPAQGLPADVPDTGRARQPWEFFDGD